jgi:hypothetical protein
MKKIICSYGNQPYYKSLDLLERTSYEIGKVDEFHRYTREWLESTEFYKKNQYILDKHRGNGYWMWKPFIILESFNKMDDGDVVLYSDAAINVISDLDQLFSIAQKEKIIVFRLPGGHLNKTWTKKDCFVLMQADLPVYHNARQTQGALSLWKKTPETIAVLKTWLNYMKDPRILTDDPNFCGMNCPGFKDHRHDQSVLSILRLKYELEQFRDPTQWGNDEIDQFRNSPYPQLFNHHRQKI